MTVKQIIKRAYRYIFKGIPTVKAIVTTTENGSRLKGKRGVITGGSKGLGYSFAQKCIEEGAEVIISGRNEQDLITAKEKLGEKCHYVVYDVENVERAKDFIKECKNKLKEEKIDFLINNAGVSFHEKEWSTVSIEGFEKQVKTNLEGPYFIAQAFAQDLISQKDTSGNIIFISSERGLMGDDIPYGLTKASINCLTRGLARKLLEYNIRVNGLAPGVTVSNMVGYKENDDLYRERSVGKRVYLPEEISEIVVFLLSDTSGCISGEIIACDQGNYQRVR